MKYLVFSVAAVFFASHALAQSSASQVIRISVAQIDVTAADPISTTAISATGDYRWTTNGDKRQVVVRVAASDAITGLKVQAMIDQLAGKAVELISSGEQIVDIGGDTTLISSVSRSYGRCPVRYSWDEGSVGIVNVFFILMTADGEPLSTATVSFEIVGTVEAVPTVQPSQPTDGLVDYITIVDPN
jgi:hypothetical protein